MDDRKIVKDQIDIYYRIRKRRGKAVVFLHGGGGSLNAWEMIFPYFLKSDMTLIAVDLRGHGLSSRPKEIAGYGMENYAEDILEIIEKEKLKKVIVVGHCLGSMVAATLSANHPEKIEKLILINPGYELPWIMSNIIVYPILRVMALMVSIFNHKSRGGRVNYHNFVNTSDLYMPRLFADWRAMGLASVSRAFLGTTSWQGRKYIRALKVPTLLIGGKFDTLYPPKVTKEIAKMIENAKVEFIDSNHVSIINAPGEVYDKIVAFLGKN